MNSALRKLINPSIFLLFYLRLRGRIRIAIELLTSKRNRLLVFTILAISLGWAIQLFANSAFRESSSRIVIQQAMIVLLTAYATWPILKSIWKRPIAESNFSEVEQSLICHGPFTPTDFIFWQLLKNSLSVTFKAATFAILVSSDVHFPFAAFLGMALCLLCLNLGRYAWERLLVALPASAYRRFQGMAITLVSLLVINVIPSAILFFREASQIAGGEFMMSTSTILMNSYSAIEVTAGAPLFYVVKPFVELITIESGGLHFAIKSLEAVLLVCASITTAWLVELQISRGVFRTNCDSESEVHEFKSLFSQLKSTSIPYLYGVGPIVWRQFRRIAREALPTTIASLPVALLAILPTQIGITDDLAFVFVFLILVLLSFLLMPAVLKFDFRSDYDHLSLFRQLAIPSIAITLGQLAVPVLVLSFVQTVTLLAVYSQLQISFSLIVASAILLFVANIFVFGFENFLYLISPFKFEESTFSMMLRTLMTFSSKILVILAVLITLIIWMSFAKTFSNQLPFASFSEIVICYSGILAVGVFMSLTMLYALHRQFDKLLFLRGC